MPFGEHEIKWFTDEEIQVFVDFDRLVTASGTQSRNERHRWIFRLFWSITLVPMVCIQVLTVVHYAHDFDILAYSMHHLLLFFNVCVLLIIHAWLKHKEIHATMDATRFTYGYNSELVDNFSKTIIRRRIKRSRAVEKVVRWCSIGILAEVEGIFILEALYLKSYKTVYPVHLGLDLDDPIVFTSVVLWQHVTYCMAVFLPITMCVLSYNAWSHIDLEMNTLKFAIANVKEIVEEQMRKPSLEGEGTKSPEHLYETYCYHFAKHHANLIRYFKVFNAAVSIVTPFLFVSGLMMLVTVGLSTMSDNLGIKVKLFGFLVAQAVVVYGWCWVGQDIIDMSQEISQIIMGTQWWLMPKHCHSTLLLIMVRCRRPLALRSPFGQAANLECFMDMLKVAYQCISVLYQMAH